jgi:hypothetical protein
VEAYRESEQSRLRGWMVRTWVDSWEGPDRGRLAPQTFKQGQGQMLVEGGDLVTLYEKPVYKENGPLRTLYLRLERGRNYRREETRKQIGVRWEASNSKDPLSLDSVRAASLPGLRALAEEHGVAIDFDAPVSAA